MRKIILLVFVGMFLVSCTAQKSNISSVERCSDTNGFAFVGQTKLIMDDASIKTFICAFPMGSSCADVEKALNIEVGEDVLPLANKCKIVR